MTHAQVIKEINRLCSMIADPHNTPIVLDAHAASSGNYKKLPDGSYRYRQNYSK